MKTKPILALLGCDAPKQIFDRLKELGFLTFALPRDMRLPKPVCSHADMLLFSLGNRIFCSEGYFNDNKSILEHLEKYGYNIIKCKVTPSDTYPHDIQFNLVYIKEHIIGKIKFSAPEIISYANDNDIGLISVNQGYTKCSTLTLGEAAVISADDGILTAATKLGLPTLKIKNSPSAVTLDGYDYGFIGGACGVLNKRVYFSGDVKYHPQGKEITEFCTDMGFKICTLCDEPLKDLGGIIFLPPIS